MFLDLSGEHRAESVPPDPQRRMADLDAAVTEQILEVTQRQKEPHLHRDRLEDAFGRRLEVPKLATSDHLDRLGDRHPPLKKSSSDRVLHHGVALLFRHLTRCGFPSLGISLLLV